MATGVKPRDEDIQFTRSDLDAIQDAMKQKKFRDLLSDYCDEIRDPANQALYQKEMVQLEKERGYDITFINPKGGYVIKTSVAGDRKAFINICSNDNVAKPSYEVQVVDGKRGMNWQIPYSMIPPREDFDHKRVRCVIYDVVFHPDTLRMAEVNKQFRELVNKTAFDGLQKNYNIHFDINNFRFPRSQYKGGMSTPAVIRKEDPDYKPLNDDEEEVLTPEMVDKLYPQRNYSTVENKNKENLKNKNEKEETDKLQQARRLRREKAEFIHKCEDGYTIPKYTIKQQKNVDMQEFTNDRDCKQHSAIPSQIVIEVNLPMLSSTKDCVLDVKEKSLHLQSEKPAKYKLEISLPYSVNDECGNAKFDKLKRNLIVTLPVIKRNLSCENNCKIDSGVESEENSESQSDDEHPNLIEELSSTPNEPSTPAVEFNPHSESDCFFDTSLGYIFPTYTHNVLDDIVAFTFHVKNTEPDSVQVKNDGDKILVKFTTIGSGYVPVHYAAVLSFEENIKFENVSGEAWDNNVILQLEVAGEIPQTFKIGLTSDTMVSKYFDVSRVRKESKEVHECEKLPSEEAPIVEVTNSGNETNIVVSSKNDVYDEDDDDDDDNSPTNEKEIVWTESNSESGAKSILRKPISMMRSLSESSADVASSMDYISSDCIPEESSYKKTVRFNDVISKQFYRYNSSIEGQKKKNQRKKSKKRSLERRKSESEAEDDSNNNTQIHMKPMTQTTNLFGSKTPQKLKTMDPRNKREASQPRLKSVLKQRRDSGLADTSDAEGDCKNSQDEGSYSPNGNDVNGHAKSVLKIIDNKYHDEKTPEIWESKTEKIQKSKPVTCETISHNTDLYDPNNLNKGQYQEVTFKNDLIFDLDM